MKRAYRKLLAVLVCATLCSVAHADTVTVAVAANMKFAFGELAAAFERVRPGDTVEVTYGSSGKLAAQIRNGAPFDLFFAADTTYPQALADQGLTAGAPRPYAVGHLVLWSRQAALGQLPLNQLPKAAIRKFAIANPGVAPYGLRAREALQKAGAWEALQPKLVLGESIAQTAQFIDTGAADAGIIALSLVLGPELAGQGTWTRIPDNTHAPLTQGYVILKRAEGNALAAAFAAYVASPAAQAILKRYGFDAP